MSNLKINARASNPSNFACNNGTVPNVGFAVQNTGTETWHTYNLGFSGNASTPFTNAVANNLIKACFQQVANSSSNCGLVGVQDCNTLYNCTAPNVPESVLVAQASLGNDSVTLNGDFTQLGDSFAECANENLGPVLSSAVAPSPSSAQSSTGVIPLSSTSNVVVTATPSSTLLTLSNGAGGVQSTTVCYRLGDACIPVGATLGATVAASLVGVAPTTSGTASAGVSSTSSSAVSTASGKSSATATAQSKAARRAQTVAGLDALLTKKGLFGALVATGVFVGVFA